MAVDFAEWMLSVERALRDLRRRTNRLSSVPIGGLLRHAGSPPAPQWLPADGASYLAADYAALFDVIGYTYGGGGGSFNVPNVAGTPSWFIKT